MATQNTIQNQGAWKRTSIPVAGAIAIALALVGGACEGQPEAEPAAETEIETQKFAIPAASVLAMEGLKLAGGKAAGAAFDWWINSLLGNDPAGDLQRNFDNIEHHLKTLQRDVKNLTVVTKQAEVDDVARWADSDREMKVRLGLYQSSMFPYMAAGYEAAALGVARTWLTQSYYTFAGTGEAAPTRFDHRIAAPVAIEAVDAWIVLRAIADKHAAATGQIRHPLDAVTKNTLREMSYQLDAKAHTALNIVHCDERRTPRYTKVGLERRLTGCTYSYSCEDGIAQTFVYDRPSRVTNGGCSAAVIRRPFETRELQNLYNPWPLFEIAAKWREISGP